MSEEIITLLSQNKDFYNSVDEIINAYNVFKNRIYTNFKQQIEEKKPNELVYKTNDGFEIKYLIAEDGEGFFYGFYLEKNGVSVSGNDSNALYIANLIKEMNSEFQNNDAYIGWVFSSFFRKFFWQDKEKIYELNSESAMNEFTDLIIQEVKNYVEGLQKLLKNACR